MHQESTVGATINRHKPRELNVEFDVYTPSRGPNIPCQGHKSMIVGDH